MGLIEHLRETAKDIRNKALDEAAHKATSFLVGDPKNGVPLHSPSPHQIAAAILTLKED